MDRKIIRLTESDLNSVIAESAKKVLSELDWRTYANAAKKNDEWRKKNPHRANQWNRSEGFRDAATDAFNKKHGLDGQYDKRYGGEKGAINLNHDFTVSGSRDHDFGDENPHKLNHNIYHLSKKYGKDGGYGRTRMWDYAHETTPEEFYGNKEMGAKFRAAEKDAEDFNSGKTKYVKGKGWSNESKVQKRNKVNEAFQNNQNYSHFAVNKTTNKIVNGWNYWNEEPSDLRAFKKDYFITDLIDYELDPKQYKIVTKNFLIRQGIDPDDDSNWSNT